MKLYNVYNGNLEIVEVINEHYMCEGATQETFLVKKIDGTKSIVSKDMYHTSEIKAWEFYLAELKSSVEYKKADIFEAENYISYLEQQITKCYQFMRNSVKAYKAENDLTCVCEKCQCLAPVQFLEICSDCRSGLHGCQSHLCFDCGQSCGCGGNKQDCYGCGCI